MKYFIVISGITIRTVQYTRLTTAEPYYTVKYVNDDDWYSWNKTRIHCMVDCLNKDVCVAVILVPNRGGSRICG